jgi:hypothetical protein
MIKGIMQSGKYVHVTGGYPTSVNIPYNYYSSPGNSAPSVAGDVRYNASFMGLEIFDGSVWVQWNPSYANVGLSPEAEELLDWAKEKRSKELEIEKLAEDNPSVQDLVAQIKEKQDQLDMVTTLLKSPETTS